VSQVKERVENEWESNCRGMFVYESVIARREFNAQRQTTEKKSAGLYPVIFLWQIEANNISWLTISKEQGPSWELIFADLYPRFMKLEGSSPFWLDPPPPPLRHSDPDQFSPYPHTLFICDQIKYYLLIYV
jgi:hypothetical protein